jgi:hypothetical protein
MNSRLAAAEEATATTSRFDDHPAAGGIAPDDELDGFRDRPCSRLGHTRAHH